MVQRSDVRNDVAPFLISKYMVRNVNTAKLTKTYIESKISQELIISRYLNIPMNVINDCIVHNHLISSVFRNDDTNKSMGIQYNAKGRLKVRDFGGFGFFGDVYDVVAYVLTIICKRKIEPNNKQDFYFILKHIANTFSDIISNESIDDSIEQDIKNAVVESKNRRAVIEFVPRSWTKHDKLYWEKLGISLGYLNTHFVYPVDQYYIDRGVDSEPKYTYKQSDPCYAYMLGQDRKGVRLIKLYFPNRNRKTELKFITNCNVLEGLLNLELTNYDYILITKSSKDRLSIGSRLTAFLSYGGASKQSFYGGANGKLNIGVINLPSENYHLKEKEYLWLVDRLAPNGIILSLLDFDCTGRAGAKYMYDNYGIPYLFITRGEFGLPNYECKDFAELADKYTSDEINQFINETLTYVKLRFANESDKASDYTELPYFE